MKLPIYQVDAFSDRVFSGNPAAVCILDEWIEDTVMQGIAAENNLAETAFIVKKDDLYEIRWFAPKAEVDLCGHATLAAAHVLFTHLKVKSKSIDFLSPRSGDLKVTRKDAFLELDFPVDTFEEVNIPAGMNLAMGEKPLLCFKGKTDYMLIYESEEIIKSLCPDFKALKKIDARGFIVSAQGKNADFVSRFFAPMVGVNEDPVTGSAHTTLTPYWSAKLNKTKLKAEQLSERGGILKCEWDGDRVKICGQTATYLIGEIII